MLFKPWISATAFLRFRKDKKTRLKLETITDLQPQKRDKERLNVYLDGAYAFSVSISLSAGLKVGQKLSADEVAKIKSDDANSRARQLSFRFLSYRPRSTAEVRNYLRRKGFDQAVIDGVINQLLERDYLDDTAFAEYWIDQRLNHRPRGRLALRYELLEKGISSEVIDAAIDEIDEKDAALRAVEKKTGRWNGLSKDDFKRKVSGFLQRRGFSYSTIAEVAEMVWLSIEDDQDV